MESYDLRAGRKQQSVPRPAETSGGYAALCNERALAILPRIKQYKAEGLSLNSIARRLNEEDVPTISRRGHWNATTVQGVLKRDSE